jgi:hypothetical protein
VIAVSADDPTAASIADFRCEKTAPATVTLTWRKTTPYTRLEIKRTYLTTPGAGETPVLDLTNAATDPQSHEDTNLAPGSYEYVARVTAGARALPEIRCRVTLGRGEVLTFVRVSETTGSGGQEPVPFAVTVTDSQTVMVADLLTGDAETFDLDLNPTGSPIPGPFDTGLTTGLEFNPRDGKLYWLQNLAGRHVLQATSVTGAEEGNDPVSVDIPFNLVRGVSLGDLSYDAARDFFWTVDLLNEVIYAVRADGSVPESFRMAQIAVPEIGGLLSGGLAAAGGEGGVATLDLLFGARTARVVDTVSRFSVDLTTLQPVGAPQRVDLQSTIGVGDVGAVAGMAQEGEEFLYITARDSRAVYKLALGTPLPPGVLFRRGDANNDGRLNISDPSFILRFLFEAGGGPAPICADAADGNNDEAVDIGDAVFLFNYLFRRQGPPPPPFPGCGTDSETGLGCEAVSCAGA